MFNRGSVIIALGLAACGSSHDVAMAPDAAVVVAVDGSITPPMPDAPPVLLGAPVQPIVGTNGGPVLAAPKIVPIFFANDSAQSQLETFLTQLAASSYWPAVVAEYGVGAMTIAPTVIATETPPTTDNALKAIIAAHAGGTGGWPANTPDTIYSVFLPDGVTLTMGGGTSCVQFAGYHSETNAGVIYALMPRCTSMTFQGLDEVTIATSHEFVEAATDPHPFSNPAYANLDDEHAIWGLAPGGELGDMCEVARASFQRILGTFMVQRTWSNASAAAGHDPCVPVLATPYVIAATNLADITLGSGSQAFVTRGVSVPMGTSKTVEVDLYSDGAAADWTVVPLDGAVKFNQATPELTFALDKSSGHSGDKLQLTITRVAPAAQQGVSELMLLSQVGGVTVGTWFALVAE